MQRDDGESEQPTFASETESLFLVLDETPICSEIRVCAYMSAYLTNIQCATALTLIFIHNMRSHCKRNSVFEWKKSDSLHVGRGRQSEWIYVRKQMRVICRVVCVFVNHVDQCMECKRKESLWSRNEQVV